MLLLTTKRDILLKALNMTVGFVEKKQTMPILSNVYIRKTNNEITVIANDLEIQASITITGEMVGQDFIITLPGKKFYDILKTFPDNIDISLEQTSNRVLIKSGKSKFTIQSLPAEHYPLLKISTPVISQFTISQSVLKKLLWKVQYAMADKDSRVFLNGMYFEVKNNQLCLVATDANRLAHVTAPLNGSTENYNAIIPRKTILELSRLLEDTPDNIAIKIYPSQVSFETNNKQLITKVIDGKYPNYERVIPIGNDKLCLINRDSLLKAVERVAVIGIDDLKTLTFELNPNLLTISCRNKDQEESRDEIETVYANSTPITANFNLTYIRDLLTNCNAETLQWAFFDNRRSALVTIPNESDFKAVVMPLRE